MDANSPDSPYYDPDRVAIHELLGSFGGPDTDMEGVLVGWTTVAEWMLPNGRRMLTFLHADATGNPAPPWQIVGYLRDALERTEHKPIILSRGPVDDDEDDD